MDTLPRHSEGIQGYSPVSKNDPENIFNEEIESWCFALSRFPDPLSQKLIHALIREMAGSFHHAIKNHFAFDLVKLSRRLHEVCDGIVNEKELAFHLLACLPNPQCLDKECLEVFEQIVAQAQNIYPEIVQRFENRLKKSQSQK